MTTTHASPLARLITPIIKPTFALFAALAIGSAWAAYDQIWTPTTQTDGKYYWDESSNWVNGTAEYGNYVINLPSSAEIYFRSSYSSTSATWLFMENGGSVTFSGDDASCGLSLSGNMTIGTGLAAAQLSINKGYYSVGGSIVLASGSNNGSLTISGGTVETVAVIGGTDSGIATLELGGGILRAMGGGTFIGSGVAASVTGASTIDTNGKAISIETAITGSGTLTITGGGVATFTTAPTCGLKVENGVAVLPGNSKTGAIEIGAHGVLAFDLTGWTIANGTEYTLAWNVSSLTIPVGESYADSIFTIGPDFSSEITLDGTTIKATATSAASESMTRKITTHVSADGWIDNADYFSGDAPNAAYVGGYNANRRDIVVFPSSGTLNIWASNPFPANFTAVIRGAAVTIEAENDSSKTLTIENVFSNGSLALSNLGLIVNKTVSSGGVVTLSNGMLTFPAGSAFADISATSVSVTGDSIVTGDKLFSLTTAAPIFALSSVTTRLGATHFTNTSGVYTAGKKYYWIGGDTATPATTCLSDAAKWAFADSTDAQYLAGEIPGPADIAVFGSSAGSGAVLDANAGYNIIIDTNFTIYQKTASKTFSIGTKSGVGIQNTFFDIGDNKSATLYAYSTSSSQSEGIDLNSKLIGEGSLTCRNGNYYGKVNFYGDLSLFKGRAECVQGQNLRSNFYFGDDAINASLSAWSIYDNGNNGQYGTFTTTAGKNVLYYGALNMQAYERSGGNIIGRTSTFNIGGRGESSRIKGSWPSSYKPTINWTDATATFTNAAANTAALNITGGGYAYIASVPDKIGISSNGGWLVIDSGNSGVASDIINNIDANSTDATLRFDVESAVSVDSVTSSAVLNNANGFTKKGLGSLTLTGNYTKLGEVNVTDGQLVIVSNSALTQGTDYTLGGTTLCTVDGTTYTFGVGAASFNGQAYISIQAAVNAAAAAGEEIEKTVTLLRNAGEDVEIQAAGITIEYGEYANTGSITGALGIVVTWDDEQKTWVSNLDPAYIWRNTTLDNKWDTPANWETAGVAATTVPTASDVVIFPESASPWTVELTAMGYAKQLQINAPVTFSGNSITVFDNGVSAVTGTATITLGNNSGFYTGDTDGRTLTVENPIDVTAAKDYPAKITARTHSNVNSGYTLTLNGNLTGTGYLTMGGTRTTHRFNGNNSGFSGSLSIPDTSSTSSGAQRSSVYFNNANAASGSAKWLIYQYLNGGNMIGYGGGTWAFGNLSGQINNSYTANYSKNGTWWEIGACNGDDELTFTGNNRSDIIRKKGTGTLTVTAGSSVVSGYELYDGVVRLLGDSAKPRLPANDGPGNYIKFHGGTLAFGPDVTFDPSEYFVADGSFPISFSNDTGSVSTWNTQISVSFTAGLTKKGSGTLTLSQPPAYTGTTKVEDGVLYVINGEYSLTLDSSTAEVTTDKDGYRKFVPASVAISAPTVVWGDDFAKVTVSAAVTSNYGEGGLAYNLKIGGNVVDGAVGTVENGIVTFSGVDVSGLNLSRYGDVSVEVTASSGGSQAATSGSKNVMFADEQDWVDENYETTTTAAAGGSWQTAVSYDGETHKAAVVDNRFSATNCSTGDVVTVTIKDVVYTMLSDTTEVDADAQGSIALGGTESAPTFMVLTKSGNEVQWSEAEGVAPAFNTAYTIVFTFDYNNSTYSITVNGTALTVGGSATYDIVKTDNKYVKDIDFLGAGSIKAIEGVQYDAMMAVDQDGVRYATVQEAVSANAGKKGATVTLLHDTANTSFTGWKYDAASKTFIWSVYGVLLLVF